MHALPIKEYSPQANGARCDLCPLRGNNVVPPKASPLPPKLVFVGEAPGRKEEIQGAPFVGMTGQFLRSLCREVGIDFLEAALQNAALCRSGLDKENEAAAVYCAPRLLRELAGFNPKVPIVTLGKASTLAVLGVRSIMHARGFIWTAREINPTPAWRTAKKAKLRGSPKRDELWLKAQIAEGRSKLAGRTVLPTVHPAFVLRSDIWLPILKLDLDRIARWLRGELTYKKLLDNGPYVVVSKRDDIRREFRKLKNVISVDIETAPSTPGGKDGANPMRNRMLCVGMSDGKHTVVVWPWRKTHAPLVNALFRRVKTIGMHNGFNFDQIALKRFGVPFEPVEDKLEDTLIAHHTFSSNMPQRLSHVASVFVDVSPWKITFKRGKDGASEKGLPPEKLSGEDLCRYNALDCIVQARVWLAMQADLKSEQEVYEVDKTNARMCRGMVIAGIGVDLDRREELRDGIIAKEADLLRKMRKLLRRKGFHPMQLSEVRKALFDTLGAPLEAADPTKSGLPSTAQKTLERLKENPTRAGRFADLLLQWRGAVKIRSTYIDSHVLDKPSKRAPTISRVHLNWKSFGAASGRYSGRLQSCPRAEYLKDGSTVLETRVREFYVARPGCKLVYFDLAQAELRFSAYLSGDKNFVSACESGDVHTATAQLLFPADAKLIGSDPKGAGKPFRDVEKNSIFGFCYYADPTTIFGFVRSKGLPVEMRDVLRMHDMIRENFADYFRYVERNKRMVDKVGHMRCAISGRIRWLGWHSGYPDVANCMDEKTEALTQEGWVGGADLRPGQRILTKNAKTGEFTWETITHLHRFARPKEKLYEFKSRSFSAVTTAGHRWLVRARKAGIGIDRCMTTEELARGSGDYSIHRTGTYAGSLAAIYTDEFVELIGWLLTDGSIRPDLFCVFQSKRANVKRIDALFERLSIKVTRTPRPFKGVVWRVNAATPLVGAIARMFPARILPPSFLRELTAPQLRLLLETMMRGDGTGEDRSGARRRFICRDKSRADAFQMLCTLCGIAATLQRHKGRTVKKQYKSISNRPKSGPYWTVTLLRRDTAQVLRHPKRYGKAKKQVDHVRVVRPRPVWCPTVKNTFFVARREGCVYITGNSPIQGGIASLMNARLPVIKRRLPPGAHVVAQIHDAGIMEVPDRYVQRVRKLVKRVWDEPVTIPANGWGSSLRVEDGARQFVMPIDLKVGERWSDL